MNETNQLITCLCIITALGFMLLIAVVAEGVKRIVREMYRLLPPPKDNS